MSDRIELLQKVMACASTDPEPDLDRAVTQFFNPDFYAEVMKDEDDILTRILAASDGTFDESMRAKARDHGVQFTPYTASVDAVLALIKRHLDDDWYMSCGRHSWGCHGVLYMGEGTGRVRHEILSPTLPLGLLAALLMALGDEERRTVHD